MPEDPSVTVARAARAQGMADAEAGVPSRFDEYAPDAGRSAYIVGYADAIRARRAEAA